MNYSRPLNLKRFYRILEALSLNKCRYAPEGDNPARQSTDAPFDVKSFLDLASVGQLLNMVAAVHVSRAPFEGAGTHHTRND
jgi:hypothetical protein